MAIVENSFYIAAIVYAAKAYYAHYRLNKIEDSLLFDPTLPASDEINKRLDLCWDYGNKKRKFIGIAVVLLLGGLLISSKIVLNF